MGLAAGVQRLQYRVAGLQNCGRDNGGRAFSNVGGLWAVTVGWRKHDRGVAVGVKHPTAPPSGHARDLLAVSTATTNDTPVDTTSQRWSPSQRHLDSRFKASMLALPNPTSK